MKKKEITKREVRNKRGGCVEDKSDEQEGNRYARTPRFDSKTPCALETNSKGVACKIQEVSVDI